MQTFLQATVTVAPEIYQSLPSRPDRVRECIAAAAQSMGEEADLFRRVLSETPRLVDQQPTALGYVHLVFQADSVKR